MITDLWFIYLFIEQYLYRFLNYWHHFGYEIHTYEKDFYFCVYSIDNKYDDVINYN